MRCDRRSTVALLVLVALLGARTEGRAAPGDDGWAFSYPEREAKSLIDLRSLNETVAGQSGFVRLSPDGNGFVLGDGTPARFWAIGSDLFRNKTQAEIARHVRFLARMGVNLVRIHAQVCSNAPNSKVTDVNEKEIDGIWRFVAEAKKQGIYTTISPYWANVAEATRWGIEGYNARTQLLGLLFFDETLQGGYRAWMKALYGRKNPYTGVPLAKEPAVALIQIQNEDSLLFWTYYQIKPPQKARLDRKYADWLVKKYGKLDAAKAAWGGTGHNDDKFADGKVGMFDIYQMTIPQAGPMKLRIADQVAFLAGLQRKFYDDMGKFFREELGSKHLINASNWKTANQTVLDDSERWSYSGLDVIAVNRYYNGGSHLGANAGWRIEPGDHFTQESAVLNPRELPLNLKQVVGRPMVISESTWVTPLAFQSEGPFLAAVYESLTGVDAFYWFSADDLTYRTQAHFPFGQVRGQQTLLKWSASIPPILGEFPACALLFRKGYVKQGEPVVHEERPLKSLWERDTPMIAEDPSFDPNRDQAQAASARPGEKVTAVDPLAFLVGPVEVKYDGDPRKSRVADLSKYIDHQKKQVRSVTGEILLDYNQGYCTVDAPRAQGACGFLDRAGTIKLADLSIKSSNPYATVLAVPLDDQPLATSKKVLVQIGTAARPTGWATKPAEFKGAGDKMVKGLEVVSTGKDPWRIADAEVALTLRNPGLTRGTRLDPAGLPAEDVKLTREPTGVTFTPPAQTMYLLLEAPAK